MTVRFVFGRRRRRRRHAEPWKDNDNSSNFRFRYKGVARTEIQIRSSRSYPHLKPRILELYIKAKNNNSMICID